MSSAVTLDDLVGVHVIDGVGEFIAGSSNTWEQDTRVFMLRIDGVVHAFAEDADDGYRSSLKDVMRLDGDGIDGHCVMRFPPLVVNAIKCPLERRDTLAMIDERTGLAILEIGTEEFHDYYPSFVARWNTQGIDVDWLNYREIVEP